MFLLIIMIAIIITFIIVYCSAITHQLPDWVGTNTIFTEGPHMSYILSFGFECARVAAFCHILSHCAARCHILPHFAHISHESWLWGIARLLWRPRFSWPRLEAVKQGEIPYKGNPLYKIYYKWASLVEENMLERGIPYKGKSLRTETRPKQKASGTIYRRSLSLSLYVYIYIYMYM